MENKSFSENISEIKKAVRIYLETKLSYVILIVFDKAVKAFTVVLGNAAIVLMLFVAFFFFSLAASLYIGKMLGSAELGLLIVGGVYLFLGFVFILFKKQIFSRIIIKYLVNVFFKDDDDFPDPDQQKK